MISNDEWIVRLQKITTETKGHKMDEKSKQFLIEQINAQISGLDRHITWDTERLASIGKDLSNRLETKKKLEQAKKQLLQLDELEDDSDDECCGECC